MQPEPHLLDTTQPFYGWKLLAALWVVMFVNVAFIFYGAAVINTWMAADFGLDRQVLGLVFSGFILVAGLNAPLVAYLINKLGVRLTMVLGSACIFLGTLAMATVVNSGLQAIIVFGLLCGLGVISGGGLSAQSAVTYWFVRKRALALSLVMSAPGIGGFVATPLLNRVITNADGNWRAGWYLVALLSCVSLTVAALFIRNKPESMGQVPDGIQNKASDPVDAAGQLVRTSVYRTSLEWELSEVVRTRFIYLVMLCAVGFGSSYMLFLAHGIVHLQDLGHTPAAAARSLSIVTLATLMGNFLIGGLGDRIEPRYLLVCTLCCAAIAMFLVVNASGKYSIYPYAIFLGVGFGGSVVAMMTMISNTFGAGIYASIVGGIMAAQTLASACMPFIAGYIFDTYHSYSGVFYFQSFLCVTAALLIAFNPQPVKTVAQTG